jgi:hypothetical protein
MSLAVLHGPPIPCLSKAQQNIEGKIELAGLEKRLSTGIVRIPRNSHLQINSNTSVTPSIHVVNVPSSASWFPNPLPEQGATKR